MNYIKNVVNFTKLEDFINNDLFYINFMIKYK